jgi:two-component system, sensor histidine kinase
MEKPKILLVDDRTENLISLEMILADFDVTFIRATSGMEALRKTLNDEFALVILDVQMPGMDGYETLSLMRKRRKTKYLPVIFVSAIHQSDLHIVKGIETGAVDFIPKPIIPEVLIGKVRVFLDLYIQKEKLRQLLNNLEINNKELAIQREKAEEATRAKAMFLANMSHEIRTPLNGIIGIFKILEDTKLTEKQQELIQIITTSGENLMNIINDILDFSKIEAGQILLEKIELNIGEIISNAVKLLRFNAEEKGLKIHIHIDKDIPDCLIGDPLRLNQVLTNMINNAIKFTNKGSITISAEITEKTKEEVAVLFKITDTGIGISEEGKAKLFKEFSQTDDSTTRKYGGTGLGLAICRNLIHLMNGELGVESQLGKGTMFWFILKYPYKNKPSKKVEEKITIPKDLRILIAEDNAVNQRITQLLLHKIGVKCDIAHNGREAFEMFRENNYKLILMDMQMPELDGVESTRKIREYEKNYPEKKEVYIVAVTANAFSENREQCFQAGMNNFIIKPFKESELKNIIQHAVRKES